MPTKKHGGLISLKHLLLGHLVTVLWVCLSTAGLLAAWFTHAA